MHPNRTREPGLAPLCALALAAVSLSSGVGSACDSTANTVSDDAGWHDFADADPLAPDAGPNPGCDPSGPQCNNCADDDTDGLIDGFDPQCTSPLDDLEESFATGIPGDNIDSIKQDCFFDGNSGAGDDGCDLHVCCLLDLGGEPCPSRYKPEQYDPLACDVSPACITNCEPLTPPGCDCFGCCTICTEVDDCRDILTNSAVAPDCTPAALDDPDRCPPCQKIEECGPGDCVPLECNLCPGMTADDLPPECEQPTCPGGLIPCGDNTDCNAEQFCSVGCCIDAIG